jgi:hypothetical protein
MPVSEFDVCDYVEAYETARADGEPAELERFLPNRGHPKFIAVLAELVRVEMEYAWTDGRPKRLEDYRTTFPEIFDDRATLTAVAFEEYRLRRLSGEHTDAEEYRQRYGLSVSEWFDDAAMVPTLQIPHVEYPPEESAASNELPHVGSTFQGFRLDAELGRGAFGRVYLAHQIELAGRPVALKITPVPGSNRRLWRGSSTPT